MRIIIVAVEANRILSEAERHIHIILIVFAWADWWLAWTGISGATRVTWTLTWGSVGGRRRSGREEVSFTSLLIILGLVHSDLHVIWFLNGLGQVNYQVVADRVFIRRNTLFYATGFIDHFVFLAVDPSSPRDWSLHQIRLCIIILLWSCVEGSCTTCRRLLSGCVLIFGGCLNRNRVCLVHRIQFFNEFASWRLYLIQVNSLFIGCAFRGALRLHTIPFLVNLGVGWEGLSHVLIALILLVD